MALTGTLVEADGKSHRSAVFEAAYRILGSVGEAEDVTQEVWMRAAAADGRPGDGSGLRLKLVAARAVDGREHRRR